MSEDSRNSEEKSYKSSLFVRNLAENIEADDLRTLCSKYGEVKDIYIPIDYHSGKRKGFAFIELFTPKEAVKVLEKINGKDFKGSRLCVMVAKQGRKTASEMKRKERHFRRRSESSSSGSNESQPKKRRSKKNRKSSPSEDSEGSSSSRSRSRSKSERKSSDSSSKSKKSSSSEEKSSSGSSSGSESKKEEISENSSVSND